MIKLQLVIPTLDQSGAEKQFGLLATRLPREEFTVRVLALSRGGPYAEILRAHQVPVTVLNKRWRFDPRTVLRVRRAILDWRPDALLSWLFAGNTTARLATLGLRPRPVTLVSERCVDSWKSGWQLWLDRRLRKRTDRLIANSRSVGTFYEQQGYPTDRVVVIPNGVETPPPPTLTRADLCRQCGLPEHALLVAYVGRLARQKQLKSLIWGMQLLRQVNDRAYLLLIGEGPERGDLELFAHDVEASRHVRFLGPRPDAASLLHLVDVFWLGSAFEGMSNSLMEAMACGKPVVVSDIPPNRELVTHGQEGWIVDLGDSVGFSQYTLKLLADRQLAERMGAAGQARMEREFSIDQMVARYAELIRDEVARRRS